ncbi:chromate transport protein ChrA [Fonsecaea pedrosoi]|nr:chromate transport protein ChrA [Fonsecaea pedrosoi]
MASFKRPSHDGRLHKRFVEKYHWLDEPMFQELFAVTQALSGPASTKMLYCINLNRNGFLSALSAFLLWSLPGAIGMYGLSLGISNVDDILPAPAYALLSGLNAATVGIIALAAVQLSQKAITDKITRILVFLGATAGMLYNALWFFPVLIFLAGPVTIIWDFRWPHALWRKLVGIAHRIRHGPPNHEVEMNTTTEQSPDFQSNGTNHSHRAPQQEAEAYDLPRTSDDVQRVSNDGQDARVIPRERELKVSWKFGTVLIASFFLTFITVMVLRGVVKRRPLLFSLFSNMYLAGTIIFGGGPVVIPLLRQYIVTEGWVSSRDFLLGLAIIQSFPGPNFNFAVYLGSLTAINASYPSAAGAIIGFIGIFAPGLILVHGTMGLWKALRTRRWVKAALRGVNAAAVGLIYTAIYRLWEIGYIDEEFTSGSSLGRDPWWVVVTATSYVGGCWFGVPVPVAILLGGVMGLIRYGVISS